MLLPASQLTQLTLTLLLLLLLGSPAKTAAKNSTEKAENDDSANSAEKGPDSMPPLAKSGEEDAETDSESDDYQSEDSQSDDAQSDDSPPKESYSPESLNAANGAAEGADNKSVSTTSFCEKKKAADCSCSKMVSDRNCTCEITNDECITGSSPVCKCCVKLVCEIDPSKNQTDSGNNISPPGPAAGAPQEAGAGAPSPAEAAATGDSPVPADSAAPASPASSAAPADPTAPADTAASSPGEDTEGAPSLGGSPEAGSPSPPAGSNTSAPTGGSGPAPSPAAGTKGKAGGGPSPDSPSASSAAEAGADKSPPPPAGSPAAEANAPGSHPAAPSANASHVKPAASGARSVSAVAIPVTGNATALNATTGDNPAASLLKKQLQQTMSPVNGTSQPVPGMSNMMAKMPHAGGGASLPGTVVSSKTSNAVSEQCSSVSEADSKGQCVCGQSTDGCTCSANVKDCTGGMCMCCLSTSCTTTTPVRRRRRRKRL